MPGKKKFINKNEAVTFHLVHRSQKDPLIVDEDSSKHVLVEAGTQDVEKRKAEQRKFGVFYDDEYNYMQHLRERNEVYELEPVNTHAKNRPEKEPKQLNITLPASVFQSEFEKNVGLLNELPAVGPQPTWDPDIVAALDDDFDFNDPENQLDDDFVVMAQKKGDDLQNKQEEMADGSDLENVSDLDSNEAMTDDEFDPDFQYGDNMFMDEETKSRFTNYSMSSSVIRRNDGLTLLDDRFEKLFEEYDDDEIGALDDDEIDGRLKQDSKVFQRIMEEFEKKQQKRKTLKEVVDNGVEDGEDLISDESEDSDTEIIQVEVKPEEKWDCESILSTYSNLYNHPKLISEPKKVTPVKLAGRHGIPEESIALRGLTEKEVINDLVREPSDRASTYRPKGETTAEKTQRKKAIKEERKERRQEKKANKMAFKKEKIRQDKEIVNLHQNLTSVRIV